MQLQFQVDVPARFRESRFWRQIRDCYIDETSYFYDMIYSIERDELRPVWTDRRRRLIVAVDNDRVVGIACLESDGTVNVFVRPAARRQGIGTVLYNKLRSLSEHMGWHTLRPGCRHDTVSSRFYSSLEDSVQSSSMIW